MLSDANAYCLGAVVLTCKMFQLVLAAVARGIHDRRAYLKCDRIFARIAETQKLRKFMCERT